MKIFKKFSLIALTLLLCSSLGVTTAHADISTTNTGDVFYDDSKLNFSSGSSLVQPLAEITCETSPTRQHIAYARGYGVLYRGTNSSNSTLIYDDGCAWQCPYCYMVIVTRGEAALGYSIANYATYNPGKATSIYGVTMYSNNIFYTSSSTLSGVSFRYSK